MSQSQVLITLTQEACNALYAGLWDQDIQEHPELHEILRQSTGLSDIFGQNGHCCQATELWRIRCQMLGSPQESKVGAQGAQPGLF